MKHHVRYNILMAFLAIGMMFVSCKQERSKGIPKSTGKTAEILIVADELVWKGPVGDALRNSLLKDVDYLPQPEPRFFPVNIPIKSFTDLYQKHHKIILVEIDEKLDSAMIQTKADYWASPQQFIRMRAPSEAALIAAFQQREQNVLDLLENAERNRMIQLYEQLNDLQIRNRLREQMGISLLVPSGFYIAKMEPEFAWLRKETKDFSQGLLIYFTPYNDTAQFSTELILNRRNQLTQIHVPGTAPGSYMITSPVIGAISEPLYFKDRFAVKTYGLWDVQGDFMGGPFLNYAILDETKNRILNLDAFVYFPNNEKRDLMLQMDALIHTLEINP